MVCLTVPSTVVEICDKAFYDCDYLEMAYIPASVEKMGYRVFYYGNSLKVYCEADTAPQGWNSSWYGNSASPVWGVSEIVVSGDYMLSINDDGTAKIFSYSGSVKMLEIPSEIDGYTVSAIGEEAFYNCDNLIGVIFPDTVTEIGEYSFYDCDSLCFAYIPSSVSYVGYYAFYYGDNLKIYCEASSRPSDWDSYWYGSYSVSVIWSVIKERDEDNFSYSVYNGNATITGYNGSANFVNIPSEIDGYTVTEIASESFYYKDTVQILIVPDTVEEIGSYAFYDCDYIKEIYIPSSVTYIGTYAFYYSSSKRIYCEASSKPSEWSSSWNRSGYSTLFWGVTSE